MKSFLRVAASSAGLAALVACGASTSTSPDTGTPDSGTPETGASESGISDTSGHDSGVDTGLIDVGVDAGSPRNALYAHIAQRLVRVDPDTGTIAEIGMTGQEYIAGTWDPVRGAVVVLIDWNTAPRLGTIDLCTAVITPGVRLNTAAGVVANAESFTRDPATGTYYVGYDANGDPSSGTLSETLGLLDPDTGRVTPIGRPDTAQDDVDVLGFVGSELRALDVNWPTSAVYYNLNATTAVATALHSFDHTVVRFAFDPTRSKVFVARSNMGGTTRSIATMADDSRSVTDIGHVLPTTQYPGAVFGGIFSVPEPTCAPRDGG